MSFLKPTSAEYLENPSGLLVPNEEDCITVTEKIKKFIKGYFSFYGFRKAIIGLSGGIDSTIIAHLCQEALGEGNVYGVIIPSKYTSAEHIEFALATCKKLNIEYNDFDIVHEYFDDCLDMLQNMGERESDEKKQRVKLGNMQARMRMIILRDTAKKYKGLVMGTTNKTEMKLGYSTIAGDGLGGVDIEPIAGLYKTSEKEVAHYLKVSEEIITQNPTAELWEGQSDEGELGMYYELIDQMLLGLKLELSPADIVKAMKGQVEASDVERISEVIKKNSFKNGLPPTVTI